VRLEGKPGLSARAFDHPSEPSGGERDLRQCEHLESGENNHTNNRIAICCSYQTITPICTSFDVCHFLIVWCQAGRMFRVLAICLVAMAAIDLTFFDGQHIQVVKAAVHHFMY
jgi:hypothetical protein